MTGFKSQAGQDKFVCEYFNKMQNGFFIDIGAYDGITFSNTHYLENELCWKGVCVEAGSKIFETLIKVRSCECVNVAIYKKNRALPFYEDDFAGKISVCGSQAIQGVTMASLLKMTNAPKIIQYISLDIEGGEYNALLGFPFDEYKVILWTIEHNSYMDGGVEKRKIKKIMLKNGYEIIREDVESNGLAFEDWYVIKNI